MNEGMIEAMAIIQRKLAGILNNVNAKNVISLI